MNKSGRNKIKQRSAVSRKLLMQYVISIIGYVVGVMLFVFVAWRFCMMFIWQPDDPLYILLQTVKEYIILFLGITFLIGWVFITYYFISKPLRYLDEVVVATEQLVVPSDEPIVLPNEMFYAENELNRVREKALDNARTVKEAEQRKNDLVMYLAHDLKTPLSSVIGYLTLLRDEQQISAELRERYLSISLEKAERLEDLINEFFEIARFNLSNISLEYGKVNLTRMLEQITYEFKPMFLEKNLKCELEIAPDTMIKCDVNKMQRVFDNLLRNAVNYSFDDSTIHIAVKQNGENLCIQFTNCGNTIPKEKLVRIFEQFYRLDVARSSRSGGAGLGLAVAKEIVELHNGTITAKSENEQIEFTVTLPLL